MIAQGFPLICLLAGIVAGLPTTYEEANDQVTFYLRNKELGDAEIQLTFENLNVVDVSKPIYFLSHGWMGSRNASWVVEATEAYLSTRDYNVVQVDWSGPASQTDEAAMIKDARVLGKTYGKLVSKLMDDYSLPSSNIYLIGHSLGAHISGFAGKAVKEYSGKSVGTVKALDPANYLDIESATNEEKLYKDDADVVIAIHTEGGVQGMLEPIGSIDFFPNGGSVQPCTEISRGCGHMIVTDFFVESIYNQNGFVSTKCESYEAYESGVCSENKKVTLGAILTTQDEGSYYLDTNAQKPYSKE